jgi:D-alanine-D-alanine ligase
MEKSIKFMKIGLIKSFTDKPWRSPETYQLIEDGLSECLQVESIATQDPEVLRKFFLGHGNEKPVFAFNIAEYLDEANKAFFIPELLDQWGVEHLGSSARTVAVGLDKARTKELLLENQIPTPEYFVAVENDTKFRDSAEAIGYPLIVKPLQEGGHIGIEEDSIVHDADDLALKVRHVWAQYAQPALVEAFISGEGMREFSVGILDGEERIYTPVEIDFERMDVSIDILSYEAAQNDLERIKLVPDDTIRAEIIDLADRAFDAVGASDYSRVDLRMNHNECYVLEVNVMPGLGPQSFLPESAQQIHGLAYRQFIQKLAQDSIARNHIGIAA